jgi:hypothetical protein
VWFRTALLLIFWLLVYRFISSVLRQLSRPRTDDAPRPRGKDPGGPAAEPSPGWEPSDVIDVPFREAAPEEAPKEREKA